ncbi:LysR family transcriptional regulator [Vibrio sp. 10N.261.55.A7]|uniref:LysR family transcriptional regulator n=1 Tax=Vibrio sp. 10N.261.55.A7 TaxID=1880851 RepID=UPI000C82B370|nr:LysR family transcriptional regulator [Vibrio sp. 10N.261.55.A7]PMJ91541.1 LysR family transcriptional regulator [Vibrio sp. 10N.261.55.A7]
MNWTSVCFDWNRTRAFLVTAEEGTLSSAAIALNMTQPTLSRQVSALEKEIGVALFKRVGQRLELTDSGIELLEVARRMGEAACDFSLVAQGQSQKLEGNVVISACQLDAVFRLPKIIASLREKEPGISIEVVVTNSVSDLTRREADIAIRSFQPTQSHLITRKLGQEVIRLYGVKSYTHPLREVDPEIMARDVQIIGFNKSDEIMERFRQQGLRLTTNNFKVTTDCLLTQVQLCKSGLGLMCLTQDVGDCDPQFERAIETAFSPIQLPVWVVCHEELHTNLRVRRVFDFVSESLKQHLLESELLNM